jgi:hypothetical protein
MLATVLGHRWRHVEAIGAQVFGSHVANLAASLPREYEQLDDVAKGVAHVTRGSPHGLKLLVIEHSIPGPLLFRSDTLHWRAIEVPRHEPMEECGEIFARVPAGTLPRDGVERVHDLLLTYLAYRATPDEPP